MPLYGVAVQPELAHFTSPLEDRFDFHSDEYHEWNDKKMIIQSESWFIVWEEEEDPDGEHLHYFYPATRYETHPEYAPQLTIIADNVKTLKIWFVDGSGKHYPVGLIK